MITHCRRNRKAHRLSGLCSRELFAVFVLHILYRGRHSSADLDPEVHLIALGKTAGKFDRHAAYIPVIGFYAPNEQAAVIRAAVAHHIAARTFLEICRSEITVENLGERFPVRIGDFIAAAQEIGIDSTPVGIHDHSHVFRTLHASFDLQGGNTGCDKLRQDIDRIEIARRKQVLAC